MQSRKFFIANGLTAIEFLVGFAIIAFLTSFIWYAFSSFRDAGALDEASAAVLSLLRDARARTLSSQGNTTYGVHFEETKAVLFSGAAYNSADASNEPYIFSTSVKISAINLGGPADVIFQRLTGAASASGTITLQSKKDSSRTKTITILATGNIQ